jgi:transcription initiation factor IIE alpha subunit
VPTTILINFAVACRMNFACNNCRSRGEEEERRKKKEERRRKLPELGGVASCA